MSRLILRGMSKSFGSTRALSEVGLEAAPGEVHAVIGENGAGKSTLMRILCGEIAPEAGSMLLDGAPFSPRSPADARKQGVSFVSQEVAVCPHLTVLENVMLGQERTRRGLLDRSAMQREARAALEMLNAQESVPLETRVGDLPLVSKQLVEIARALVGRAGCRVLILDEPSSSLGREEADRLFAVIRRLCAEGVTVIYVSHYLEEVRALAQTYTVLRDGSSVASGKMADVSLAELVHKMVGRRIEQLFVRSKRTAGDVILEVEELVGDPKPQRASMRLRRGEVLGLAGLLGAGRTELLRTLFGLSPVKGGTVRLQAWVGPGSPSRRLAQGLGLLSEDRKGEGLAATLSVADNLTLSRLPTVSRMRLFSPKAQRECAQGWIERLGIKARSPGQPVADLSGGNQQKVALARLLHHGVDVLLLDEPTRGIDVGSKAQIYELIDKLAIEGKAILMVSSYLPELLGTCDRIQVMRRGILGPARPVEDCTAESLLSEALGARA